MKLSSSSADRYEKRYRWIERYRYGVPAFAWLPTYLEDTGQWIWLESYTKQLFESYDKGWIFKNYSEPKEHLR